MRGIRLFSLRSLVLCFLFLAPWGMAGGMICGAGALAAEQEQGKKDAGHLKQVMPEAERFEPAQYRGTPYWVAYRGSDRIGGVFKTEGIGYAGPLEVMTGIDSEGKITGAIPLSHRETPALAGDGVLRQFMSQFVGKKEPFILKRDDPSGNIDAIASATVSSRAVMGAMAEAMKIFQKELGAGTN